MNAQWAKLTIELYLQYPFKSLLFVLSRKKCQDLFQCGGLGFDPWILVKKDLPYQNCRENRDTAIPHQQNQELAKDGLGESQIV